MFPLLLIILFTFILFGIEFLLFHVIGPWAMPNLLLLLVIFFTLYSGIRYGLVTAFVAGFVRDSLPPILAQDVYACGLACIAAWTTLGSPGGYGKACGGIAKLVDSG